MRVQKGYGNILLEPRLLGGGDDAVIVVTARRDDDPGGFHPYAFSTQTGPLTLEQLNSIIFGDGIVHEIVCQNVWEFWGDRERAIPQEGVWDTNGSPTEGPGVAVTVTMASQAGVTFTLVAPLGNPTRIDVYVSGAVSTASGASASIQLTNNAPGLFTGLGAAAAAGRVNGSMGLNSDLSANGAFGVGVNVSTPTAVDASSSLEVGQYVGSYSVGQALENSVGVPVYNFWNIDLPRALRDTFVPWWQMAPAGTR